MFSYNVFEYPREVYKHVSKEIRVVNIWKDIYITNVYNFAKTIVVIVLIVIVVIIRVVRL